MEIEKLVRAGYLTKGILYALIGILAVQTAWSIGGRTTGTQGALQTIARQPFGQILLILVTVGLIGYALWRFIEAIQDPEHKGTDAQGILSRIGYAISGIIYGGLAYSAARIVIGATGGGGGGNSTADWTALLLRQPFGQWLVGGVGALVIGLGLYKFYKAYKVKFRKRLNLSELSPKAQKWAVRISRFGIAARGFVFLIIGYFLIQASVQADASEARGIDGTLQTVARQPYGKFLLSLLALGLIAYGIYMAVQSRYRRIDIQ